VGLNVKLPIDLTTFYEYRTVCAKKRSAPYEGIEFTRYSTSVHKRLPASFFLTGWMPAWPIYRSRWQTQ